MRRDTRMQVAIVGTCQVSGLGLATQVLMPDAEVACWHVGVHPRATPAEIAARLPEFDLVVSQIADGSADNPLGISRLRERLASVVFIPIVSFTGFHPDATYILRPDGLVPGSLSDLHSAIVISAFLMGLSERRTTDLFNSFVFAELGYFDAFSAARAALATHFAAAGYEICSLLDQWHAQIGQFMYTVNHPHIKVLAALCRLALAQAGYVDFAAPLPAQMPDPLAASFVWPVYPPLAKRIGIPGSTIFQQAARGLKDGQSREVSLGTYVALSFAHYATLDPARLQNQRITDSRRLLEALIR